MLEKLVQKNLLATLVPNCIFDCTMNNDYNDSNINFNSDNECAGIDNVSKYEFYENIGLFAIGTILL